VTPIRFYMDHNVHGDITKGLRERGIDCLTLEEDGRKAAPDDTVLTRATSLGRVLVTSDADFHRITTDWIRSGQWFPGVIYFTQHSMSVGGLIYQLELIATAAVPEEYESLLRHLPIDY
jgi:predicted nuclease of predicted toxin-antitoxin system